MATSMGRRLRAIIMSKRQPWPIGGDKGTMATTRAHGDCTVPYPTGELGETREGRRHGTRAVVLLDAPVQLDKQAAYVVLRQTLRTHRPAESGMSAMSPNGNKKAAILFLTGHMEIRVENVQPKWEPTQPPHPRHSADTAELSASAHVPARSCSGSRRRPS